MTCPGCLQLYLVKILWFSFGVALLAERELLKLLLSKFPFIAYAFKQFIFLDHGVRQESCAEAPLQLRFGLIPHEYLCFFSDTRHRIHREDATIAEEAIMNGLQESRDGLLV